MGLQVGFFYELVINVGHRILTYTVKITSVDKDGVVSFIDKFGEKRGYRQEYIISYRELNHDEVKKYFPNPNVS